MKKLMGVSAALLALLGCEVGYNIDPDNIIEGAPNPPDLSTPVNIDRVVQTTVPAVDVLWVIDNSCSMSEEQAALTTNFPKFMNFFAGSGLDYHVGVVSTDMVSFAERGKLQTDPSTGIRMIDDTVSDPVGVFGRIASLGTDGDADERGRDAAHAALVTRAQSDNAGFFRDDAFLSVIVISDEDDYSNNITRQAFISWLQTVKSSPDMVAFSSIVGQGGGDWNSCSLEEGAEYRAVTSAIGGVDWDICDSNWDQVLEELGVASAGLRREFFLSELPIEDSIKVWVDEETNVFVVGADFTYDRQRNSVKFSNYIPDPLSEVFIEYEVLAAEVETEPDTGL